MSLRVGVIGAGAVAQLHVEGIANIPEVQVVAVADVEVARAEAMAARFDAASFREPRALLAQSVDAVLIAVPHGYLAPVALEAIAAGKHVLLEKPMGITLDQADAVVAAARSAGVVLQIGYAHRYRQEQQAAKRLIDEGRIGRPVLVVEDHSASGDTIGPWYWNPEIGGGGALMLSGIHGIDRIRWLAGQEIDVVYCQMGRFMHDRGLEDNAAATLHLSGGSIAAVNQNYQPFKIPYHWETHVYGTEGVLRIAIDQLEFIDRSGSRPVELRPQNRFELQFRAFTSAIRDGRTPDVPGEEGRTNLAVVLALYESARTGQPVTLRPSVPTA